MRDAGNGAADVGRTISRIAHQIIEKTALDGPDGPRVGMPSSTTRGPSGPSSAVFSMI
ncbi:hypothetical protein MAHJHV28_46860 [Mycobacterium avium subsp. hominissuis]